MPLCLATGTGFAVAAPPSLAGCPVFPSDNIWNTRIDRLPVDRHSRQYVGSIGADKNLHPDFGHASAIPINIVPPDQPMVKVELRAEESDPGPFPVPTKAEVEADTDHHLLVLQKGTCRLYEIYDAQYSTGRSVWQGLLGAVFDLRSNRLRPDTWSSSDAAGLPVLPGLVRYDEVAAGEILHALRFTAPITRKSYVWPARHYASSQTSPNLPPMGQRFRLRADYPLDSFSPACRVILRALQLYGMMLADNGSPWFITGAPDPRWDVPGLNALKRVRGSDFEAVDVQSLRIHADSGQARRQAP